MPATQQTHRKLYLVQSIGFLDGEPEELFHVTCWTEGLTSSGTSTVRRSALADRVALLKADGRVECCARATSPTAAGRS